MQFSAEKLFIQLPVRVTASLNNLVSFSFCTSKPFLSSVMIFCEFNFLALQGLAQISTCFNIQNCYKTICLARINNKNINHILLIRPDITKIKIYINMRTTLTRTVILLGHLLNLTISKRNYRF